MRIFRQFGIIIAVTLAAEVFESIIPLPIPASIYGLVFMLTGLITGLIPLSKVEKAGDFLVEIMPFMFIPASAGILNTFDLLKSMLFPLIVIIVVTTALVMGVTGLITQMLIHKERGQKK